MCGPRGLPDLWWLAMADSVLLVEPVAKKDAASASARILEVLRSGQPDREFRRGALGPETWIQSNASGGAVFPKGDRFILILARTFTDTGREHHGLLRSPIPVKTAEEVDFYRSLTRTQTLDGIQKLFQKTGKRDNIDFEIYLRAVSRFRSKESRQILGSIFDPKVFPPDPREEHRQLASLRGLCRDGSRDALGLLTVHLTNLQKSCSNERYSRALDAALHGLSRSPAFDTEVLAEVMEFWHEALVLDKVQKNQLRSALNFNGLRIVRARRD